MTELTQDQLDALYPAGYKREPDPDPTPSLWVSRVQLKTFKVDKFSRWALYTFDETNMTIIEGNANIYRVLGATYIDMTTEVLVLEFNPPARVQIQRRLTNEEIAARPVRY